MNLELVEYNPCDVVVGSMWDHKSPLFETQQELWEELVPDSGMAQTMPGEAFRSICRLYYDAYNNGGCNSANDNYIGFAHFLLEWIDGVQTYQDEFRTQYELARTIKSKLTWRQGRDQWRDQLAQHEDADDEIEGWDALDDKEYLKALEELIHWVVWKVARMQPKEG